MMQSALACKGEPPKGSSRTRQISEASRRSEDLGWQLCFGSAGGSPASANPSCCRQRAAGAPRPSRLRQNVVDDVAMHIREAKVTPRKPVGELLVVETEKM
ncbi:MAG: hypothetical protein ACI8W8_000143 [Rhodothermales bacterium]|jgi:hypothetical protein